MSLHVFLSGGDSTSAFFGTGGSCMVSMFFPVRGVYPVVRVLILPPKAPLIPGGPYGPGGLTRPVDPAEEQRERETERERGRERERERERETERERDDRSGRKKKREVRANKRRVCA